MRFVVVTGMSGGGKRTALKLLEDAGFYCVDNLPVSLVEKFVELIAMPGSEISKVALGLDVRADQNFMDATRILEQLKEKGYKFEILFMDSDDAALIKRYKETRRVHPLAADGRVEDGLGLQFLDIIRVWQESYIKDQIGVCGDSMLEPEGHDRYHKTIVFFVLYKNTIQLFLQFSD